MSFFIYKINNICCVEFDIIEFMLEHLYVDIYQNIKAYNLNSVGVEIRYN